MNRKGRSPTNPRGSSDPQSPLGRRQFSLAGLLSFTLALSVYFALLASLKAFETNVALVQGELVPWRASLAVCVVWVVLWRIYRAWRLPQAEMVHTAGPVLMSALWALAVLGTLLRPLVDPAARIAAQPTIEEWIDAGWIILLVSSEVSSLISFPLAALMLGIRLYAPAGKPGKTAGDSASAPARDPAGEAPSPD